MWKKIKDLKYPVLIKYYIYGIIIAVPVFQFVVYSLRKHHLDFNALISNQTLIYVISTLAGGIIGFFVYLLLAINNKGSKIYDEYNWLKLQKNKKMFFVRNIIAFSIGGFVYILLKNLYDAMNNENILQQLFSTDSITDYIAMIIATAVFAVFFLTGTKKRLTLLYQSQ